MQKALYQWNIIKSELRRNDSKPPFYKEGDVWWVCVGLNVGYEVYGKGNRFVRPVLILKKFNQYSFIGVPLSTKLKDNKYYLMINLNDRQVSALISQIRVLSTKRFESKLEELKQEEYERVKLEIIQLFKLSPSA